MTKSEEVLRESLEKIISESKEGYEGEKLERRSFRELIHSIAKYGLRNADRFGRSRMKNKDSVTDIIAFLIGMALVALWAITGHRWNLFVAIPNLMFGFRGMLRDS